MYLERDPSVNPGPGCDDPPSVTNYECTLWGLPICDDTATNTGQWRDNFQVVITGSNGYVKNVPPPSYTNFTGPTELGGAIQAPLANGVNTYIGMRMFPGPYDPSSCAAVCQETTTYDSQHPASDGTYMPCNCKFHRDFLARIHTDPFQSSTPTSSPRTISQLGRTARSTLRPGTAATPPTMANMTARATITLLAVLTATRLQSRIPAPRLRQQDGRGCERFGGATF